MYAALVDRRPLAPVPVGGSVSGAVVRALSCLTGRLAVAAVVGSVSTVGVMRRSAGEPTGLNDPVICTVVGCLGDSAFTVSKSWVFVVSVSRLPVVALAFSPVVLSGFERGLELCIWWCWCLVLDVEAFEFAGIMAEQFDFTFECAVEAECKPAVDVGPAFDSGEAVMSLEFACYDSDVIHHDISGSDSI